MLITSLQAIFSLLFMWFASVSVPKGWAFIKVGWFTLQTYTNKSNKEPNVESQRAIEQGTFFFVAGIAWFIGGCIAGIVAFLIGLQTLRDFGIIG